MRLIQKYISLRILILFFITLGISCHKSKVEDGVIFDTSFLSARLDSVKRISENRYSVFIDPSFEPVNKSPWFAFVVTSESEKEIEIELNYGNYKHRYIPKLSSDKKEWKKIDPSQVKIDTALGRAILKLNVSPQKLYVAAQEIESSKDTYVWLDSTIKKHPFLQKNVAAKTVKGSNNYVVNSNLKANKAIVLIARQHPPEIPGGTIGFKAFYEELLNDTKTANAFRRMYNIIAFPLLNPDGVDMGNWRHNANGVDLNRDWIAFTQPETNMVKEYLSTKIKKDVKINFAIDFHTSYSGPYMLVLDSINERKTKGVIPDWIKNIEANSQFKVETRRRSQDLPYCYNYFYNQFGSEAVTYEDGDEIDRNIIKDRAKVYAQELIKTMLLSNNTK